MSAAGLASDVAAARAEIASLRAEAARLADTLGAITAAAGDTDTLLRVLLAARAEGYAAATAAHSAYEATARARQARRGFTVITGGKTVSAS